MVNKIDIEDLLAVFPERKEFSSKLKINEKQYIIDLIKHYGKHHSYYDSFEPKELENISNMLGIRYLFKNLPSADNFKCFSEDINRTFGCGQSMTREQIDTIEFMIDACTGAPYGGLIGAVGSGLIVAVGGSSVFKVIGQAAVYGLLGAFVGGIYTGYNNKNLKLNTKFDKAVSQCFESQIEDIVTCSGEVTEDGFCL